MYFTMASLPELTAQCRGVDPSASCAQGLTLVNCSAQCKRCLWDRGCIQGLFGGFLGGVRGYWGVFRVYFVSETSQVELRCGRV